MKRSLAYVLLIMAFALLTLNFSLLGLGDRADKHLQDLFNTYAGSLVYGAPQEDITVLLLTDEALNTHQRGHWPASYDFHGKVLNSLLHQKPRAVFIDLLWLSQRPAAIADAPRDGDYLIKVLQRYDRARIPVYLAWAPAVEQNWPELKGLVRHVGTEVYIDPVDFVSRTYPAAVTTDRPTPNAGLQTPAFLIAQEVRPRLFPQKQTEPMDIFWGTSPNKKNDWMKTKEHDADLVTAAFDGFSGVKTPVPFNTTLYVRDLLKQMGETKEEVREQAAVLMKDKIVLYGANLTGVNDLVFTATRDILPGVYLHAMALDNLLRWGSEYKSARGKGLLANDMWHASWNLLVVLPVAMLLAFFHRRPGHDMPGCPKADVADQRPGRKASANTLRIWLKRVLGKLCIMLALVLWFTAWGAVEFIYFNISAGTVAGYLAFLTLGFFLDRIGTVDWLIDDAYTWFREPCSRRVRARRRHQPRA
jgi:CHASE2 domain-containing sensor protein